MHTEEEVDMAAAQVDAMVKAVMATCDEDGDEKLSLVGTKP